MSTSAGSPTKYTQKLKEAGLTVFHVVPTLRAALKAVEAGVDGLIVEGGEGGGFKNPRPVASLVLLPLMRSSASTYRSSRLAASATVALDGRSLRARRRGCADGHTHGLGAESPVHPNWKQAIVDAAETDTVFLRPDGGPALRALRTQRTTALEAGEGNAMAALGGGQNDVYFGGNLEAGVALTGQVAGRITRVSPVAEIIDATVREFFGTVEGLAKVHLS